MRRRAGIIRQPGIAREDSANVTSPRPAFPDPSALVAAKIAAFGDDPDFVTALARGLGVLLALSDKKRRMSIAQVSHRTGIPRAAARRSLHTLEKLGFVAADDARRFYLRPRVLSFSHGYLSASPIAVLAQPILDRLGDSLREACSLAMLDGDEIVYIARSSSSRIMSPALNVGRRLPAYCTSIGHVMLAHLPQDELNDYLAHARFHPYTDYTPTSAEKLLPAAGRGPRIGIRVREPADGAAPVHAGGSGPRRGRALRRGDQRHPAGTIGRPQGNGGAFLPAIARGRPGTRFAAAAVINARRWRGRMRSRFGYHAYDYSAKCRRRFALDSAIDDRRRGSAMTNALEHEAVPEEASTPSASAASNSSSSPRRSRRRSAACSRSWDSVRSRGTDPGKSNSTGRGR